MSLQVHQLHIIDRYMTLGFVQDEARCLQCFCAGPPSATADTLQQALLSNTWHTGLVGNLAALLLTLQAGSCWGAAYRHLGGREGQHRGVAAAAADGQDVMVC